MMIYFVHQASNLQIEFVIPAFVPRQVIVALSEKSRTHIPYRNSMMTSLLRDRCISELNYDIKCDPPVHLMS